MKINNSKLLWIVVFSLWVLAVLYGMSLVLNYEKTPTVVLQAPLEWPLEAPVALATTGATLVLFIHPQCPCTKATIGELAKLMTHCHGKLTAYLFFLNPSGFPETWSEGSTWKEAMRIPGTQLFLDKDGGMARLFKASSSGQCLLYTQNGKLLFEGGITSARGHRGDNAGRSAIQDIVLLGHAKTKQTAVFGCELFGMLMPTAMKQ